VANTEGRYFGRKRKFWTWGYEGDDIPQTEVDSMCKRVAERLGVPGFELLSDPKLDEIELRAPRITPPASLAHFCTTDKWDRVVHTYGKGFKDMVQIYRRSYDNPPDVIAYPRNEDEIRAVIDWCGENGYAAIPFGGGSSVVGGFFAPGDDYDGAVVIDLGNMNQVLEVDDVSRCARIQAGILGPALENALKPQGLTLRHIPQSWEFSSLGGWIATRSAGHYATMLTHIDESVQSLRVVTPTGTLENRRLPASGAGPDPDRAFIGSEGAYGIITEAWMRLQGRVKFRANASIAFKDFYTGADAVRQITQSALFPANCRYLDERDALFYGAGDGTESVLLLGFESSDHPMDAWLDRGIEICKDYGGVVRQKSGTGTDALETSRSGAQGSWRSQFRYLPYLMHIRAAMGIVSFTFETAYTWDKFKSVDAELMRRMTEALKRIAGGGIICRRFSFLYPDGPSPYYSIMAPSTHERSLEDYQAISDVASAALVELGATVTHHHAVGRTFKPWYEKEIDPIYGRMLTATKKELDPSWIMNPGLLVDRPKGLKITS